MSEKQLESALVKTLRTADLKNIEIAGSTSEARSLADLCGTFAFDVIQDDSRWNLQPKAMLEIIGGMTPDIVVRSKLSQQNRIYIEVKKSACLNYGNHDSQIIRYLLHLVASSETKPRGKKDIARAILLAAPAAWFQSKRTGKAWTYFVEHYADLARAFNVVVAVKGEGLEQPVVEKVVKNYDLGPHFTPKERVFLDNKFPSQHDRAQFTWRYEAAWTLLWALGYVEKLGKPTSICDVQRAVKLMKERTTKQFIADAKLRPLPQILDEADRIYR